MIGVHEECRDASGGNIQRAKATDFAAIHRHKEFPACLHLPPEAVHIRIRSPARDLIGRVGIRAKRAYRDGMQRLDRGYVRRRCRPQADVVHGLRPLTIGTCQTA